MKVEVQETETEKELQFPCLMIADELGFIVFVTGEGRNEELLKGTVMYGNNYWDDGYYSDGWDKPAFKPFNGIITLRND